MSSIGPNELERILTSLGLKLLKVENTRLNVGRSPALTFCEHYQITERSVPAKWVNRIEQSAPPMPETPLITGDES